MKTIYKHLWSLVLVALTLSCEVQEFSENQEGSVVDNRLHFNSEEELANFITDWKQKDFAAFQGAVRELQKNGFVSLMPVFEKTDLEKLQEFREFKLQQRKGFYRTLLDEAAASRVDVEDLDITEDEFIADPYFAALLNRDREIEIGNRIYKFTAKGILYAQKNDYELLTRAFEDLQKSEKSVQVKGVSFYSPFHLSSQAGRCIDPLAKCAPEDPGTDPTPTPVPAPPTPAPPPPTKLEVKNSLKICFWDPNLWDDIFGPAESCSDYFENDKRVKTKTWSQNYLIFSSVGIKVESQNRALGIWWADDINEVELGYTTVYFEYKLPTPSWPNTRYEYQFEYGDYRINQFGQYVGPAASGPKSLFDQFPIKDEDKKILTIYLFQPLEDILGKSSIDFTAKDVNNGIESLVKQGFNSMKSFLQKEINGTSAVVVYPSPDGGNLKFLYTNWTRTNSNDNKISETFDWNTATIGFSTKGYGNSTSPIYDSPQSYKKFQTICYGMGRRGTTWKGSRVVLTDIR
jgi:hypothetical protein